MRRALIIFAKAPRSGKVKTRLSPYLDDEGRMEVCRRLLERTVNLLGSLEGIDTRICYSPPDAEEYFLRFGLEVYPQQGEDIGMRMYHAIESTLSEGYGRAVLVGADIPGLAPPIIMNALDLLARHDVVFGPAEDGGYFLVGLRRPVKEIFEGVEWSSSATLSQSVSAAEGCGMKVALTAPLPDMDTIDDLLRERELFADILERNGL